MKRKVPVLIACFLHACIMLSAQKSFIQNLTVMTPAY